MNAFSILMSFREVGWSKMAPLCNCCFPSRRILLKSNRLLKFMLLISMALIACLHLVILPSASGGYNDECFMPDDKRRILRIMVQNISKAFNKHGVQYWLDYGEFLAPCSFKPSLAVPRNLLIRVWTEWSVVRARKWNFIFNSSWMSLSLTV